MNDQVISVAHTQVKARRAHAAGKGRDDHDMNWHADAVAVWQAEWDRCEHSRLSGNQQQPAPAGGRAKFFHGIDCLCADVCAPVSAGKGSPSMHSVPFAESGFDHRHALAKVSAP